MTMKRYSFINNCFLGITLGGILMSIFQYVHDCSLLVINL